MKKLYPGAQCLACSTKTIQGLLFEDGYITAVAAGITDNFDEEEVFDSGHFIFSSFGDGDAHPLFAGRESQGRRVMRGLLRSHLIKQSAIAPLYYLHPIITPFG